jgi:hypothetical protein
VDETRCRFKRAWKLGKVGQMWTLASIAAVVRRQYSHACPERNYIQSDTGQSIDRISSEIWRR